MHASPRSRRPGRLKSGTALAAALTLTCTLIGARSEPIAGAVLSLDKSTAEAETLSAHAASAKTPPTQASPAPAASTQAASMQAPPRAQRARPAVALTGCLKNSDDPQVFLLTSAHRADADPASEADEPSSAGGGAGAGAKASAAAAAGEGRTYRVVPLSPKIDVKSHVGERVEVGGRLLQEKIRGEESADTAASGARASGSGKSPQATIAVAYVRKLADTCTASQP